MLQKQMELVKNATPAQRAQIQEQNKLIKQQVKKAPQELPIDQDANEEAQRQKTAPNAKKPKGGKKSRRKGKKSRKVTRRR